MELWKLYVFWNDFHFFLCNYKRDVRILKRKLHNILINFKRIFFFSVAANGFLFVISSAFFSFKRIKFGSFKLSISTQFQFVYRKINFNCSLNSFFFCWKSLQFLALTLTKFTFSSLKFALMAWLCNNTLHEISQISIFYFRKLLFFLAQIYKIFYILLPLRATFLFESSGKTVSSVHVPREIIFFKTTAGAREREISKCGWLVGCL